MTILVPLRRPLLFSCVSGFTFLPCQPGLVCLYNTRASHVSQSFIVRRRELGREGAVARLKNGETSRLHGLQEMKAQTMERWQEEVTRARCEARPEPTCLPSVIVTCRQQCTEVLVLLQGPGGPCWEGVRAASPILRVGKRDAERTTLRCVELHGGGGEEDGSKKKGPGSTESAGR